MIGRLSSSISRCVRKEAMGTRFNEHASLLSFQNQQEQTVFILQEVRKTVARVRKTVARVRKKNVKAKG